MICKRNTSSGSCVTFRTSVCASTVAWPRPIGKQDAPASGISDCTGSLTVAANPNGTHAGAVCASGHPALGHTYGVDRPSGTADANGHCAPGHTYDVNRPPGTSDNSSDASGHPAPGRAYDVDRPSGTADASGHRAPGHTYGVDRPSGTSLWGAAQLGMRSSTPGRPGVFSNFPDPTSCNERQGRKANDEPNGEVGTHAEAMRSKNRQLRHQINQGKQMRECISNRFGASRG